MSPSLEVAPHPSLRIAACTTHFTTPLGDHSTPAVITDLLRIDAATPIRRDEDVRGDVRNMLRHGGYKPTGRGKPASEYLVRAATEAALASINVAVDVCNAVSLHSGFPISVVDLACAHEPFAVTMAESGTSYVFNASGQTIDLGGLVCLFDAEGPCGNAVRDSQRTKTSATTVDTLSVIWGVVGREARLMEAMRWYRELLHSLGATTLAINDDR